MDLATCPGSDVNHRRPSYLAEEGVQLLVAPPARPLRVHGPEGCPELPRSAVDGGCQLLHGEPL